MILSIMDIDATKSNPFRIEIVSVNNTVTALMAVPLGNMHAHKFPIQFCRQ